VIADHARRQRKKSFKHEQRARISQKAMGDYEAEARATREKTARLKALWLAKEAQARNSTRDK